MRSRTSAGLATMLRMRWSEVERIKATMGSGVGSCGYEGTVTFDVLRRTREADGREGGQVKVRCYGSFKSIKRRLIEEERRNCGVESEPEVG